MDTYLFRRIWAFQKSTFHLCLSGPLEEIFSSAKVHGQDNAFMEITRWWSHKYDDAIFVVNLHCDLRKKDYLTNDICPVS